MGGNTKTSFWKYTISSDTWTSPTSTPGNIDDGGALVFDGTDTIYVTQGNSTRTFWKYSIAGNSWTTLSSLPGVNSDNCFCTRHLIIKDGFIYTFSEGGESVEKYDIAQDSWSFVTGSKVAGGQGIDMVLDSNQNVYFFGGTTADFEMFTIPTSYNTSGTFTSSVKTAVNNAYGTISWNATTTNGSVTLKARTGSQSNLSDASAFSSCTNLTSGQSLSGYGCATAGQPYVQYQAALTTTATTTTPSLNDITLNYSSYSTSTENLISSALDTADAQTILSSLVWNESVPSASTTVQFQLSSSPDGSSWTSWMGTDGTVSTFFASSSTGCAKTGGDVTCTPTSTIAVADGANDRYLRYKAILTSAGNTAPTIATTTLNFLITPTAPTISSSTPPSTSSIRWSFTDNANNEDGFRLYTTIGTILISSSTPNLSSFDETGLSPNTQYSGRIVKAFNGSLSSASSSSFAAVYTLANTPTSLTLTADSQTQITAAWNANSNPAGTEYYAQNTTAGINSGWTTSTSWTSSGLAAGTPYAFSLKARNGDSVETGSVTDTKSTQAATAAAAATTGTSIGDLLSSTFIPPVSPPGGFKILINNGDEKTSTTTVVLLLTAGPDTKYVELSENRNFTGFVSTQPGKINFRRENFESVKTYQLTPDAGKKTIYARFYGAYLQMPSETVSDSIELVPAIFTSTPSPSQPVFTLKKKLAIKMYGEDIRKLQEFLAKDKTIYPEGLVSGYFGILTRKAVQRFQCKHKIVCSGSEKTTGYGVLGPKTRAKINKFIYLQESSE